MQMCDDCFVKSRSFFHVKSVSALNIFSWESIYPSVEKDIVKSDIIE